jgi:hypothetical protein
MNAHSSPKGFWSVAALVAVVFACSRPASRHGIADSARLELHPSRAQASRLPDDVRAVCDSVAVSWRRVSEAKVAASDTVIAPWLDDSAGETDACEVVATIDSIADTSQAVQTYWHVTHWPQLLRGQADGPDGESSIYQRALTRCSVARQWDGGDDEDTTAVVSSFQQETTLCWRHPRPLVATDTGFPPDSMSPAPMGAVTGAIVRRPSDKKPPR